jgi:ADP-ribose pyrophosphatase
MSMSVEMMNEVTAEMQTIKLGEVKTQIKANIHKKARGVDPANKEAPPRFPVSDEQVSWETKYPDYAPSEHTTKKIIELSSKDSYADPEDASLTKVNCFDEKKQVDRNSYEGIMSLEPDTKRPINPRGRTGMRGRGRLGRWGPNKAADPIVTRWKRDASGKRVFHPKTHKPILECVLIKRKDNGEWAIPGGMVESGESVSETLLKEFGEEAMNSLEMTDEEVIAMKEALAFAFKHGVEVYKGYVDDPRNTDNAWMETVAMNFHDEDGTLFALFKLHAGDDAVGVKWVELTDDMQLYASHSDFVRTTMAIHGA